MHVFPAGGFAGICNSTCHTEASCPEFPMLCKDICLSYGEGKEQKIEIHGMI
jgi:hypothetical protein